MRLLPIAYARCRPPKNIDKIALKCNVTHLRRQEIAALCRHRLPKPFAIMLTPGCPPQGDTRRGGGSSSVVRSLKQSEEALDRSSRAYDTSLPVPTSVSPRALRLREHPGIRNESTVGSSATGMLGNDLNSKMTPAELARGLRASGDRESTFSRLLNCSIVPSPSPLVAYCNSDEVCLYFHN